MGPRQARRLYRAIPVSTYYLGFSRATPKGILHHGLHCLAPTGSSLGKADGCVLVFFNVLRIGIDPSLALDPCEVKREV